MPYVNTYLEKTCHLSGSQIGLITAISLVLGVCVIPLWGIAGDKTRKYNALLQFSLAATLVVLYFYSKQTVYPMIVLCAILLEVSRLGTMPMADTQALIKKATEFNNLIGLDLNVDCKCPSCGNEFKTPFRDGPEFFGPEI